MSYIHSILGELSVAFSENPLLLLHNQGANYMSAYRVMHAKHVEADYYFVREKLVNKTLVVCLIPSEEQLYSWSSIDQAFNQHNTFMILEPSS